MRPTSFFGVAILATSALVPTCLATKAKSPTVIPNSYIVQLETGNGLTRRGLSDHQLFHQQASAVMQYTTDFEYTEPTLFMGLSIKVTDGSSKADIMKLSSVKRVWRNIMVPRPEAVPDLGTIADGSLSKLHPTFRTPKASPQADVNSPHRMTGVDKLHAMGIKGKGMKIALIDTGVDYYHPSLGGGFGPGFKISFGAGLVGDAYKGDGAHFTQPTPLTTCPSGAHGTHTSGIVGMLATSASPFGEIGVAPEATLGMYRVFGCEAGGGTDLVMMGIQLAVQEKADVISISLSGGTPWEEDDALALVVSAAVKAGVAVFASIGNDGSHGPFTNKLPGVDPDVISVGAVETLKYPLVYSGVDTSGNPFDYSSVYPLEAPTEGLSVLPWHSVIKSDSTDCPPAPSADEFYKASIVAGININTTMIAVARGYCSISDRVKAAVGAGFRYFLMYNTDEPLPFLQSYVALPHAGGVWNQYILVNQRDGKTILDSLAKEGSKYKLTFPGTTFKSVDMLTAGYMGNYSSYGPTAELTLKPQLSAPGSMILATWPRAADRYAIISGTSMSCPYAAATYALVKSQLPGLSVRELREIMQSTSVPVKSLFNPGLITSVAHQGAGLINAYNAITYGSRISASELSLRDLPSLKTRNITIENKSKGSQQYTVSHVPAGLARVVPYPNLPGVGFDNAFQAGQRDEPIYASASFSETSIQLEPGQSATVFIDFKPPVGLDDRTVPIYSGFIKFTSSSNEVLVAPYLGLPYSVHDAEHIFVGDHYPRLQADYNDVVNPNADYVLTRQNFTLTDADSPQLTVQLLQPTRTLRILLVPVNFTAAVDIYGFDRSITYKDLVVPKTPIGGYFLGHPVYGMVGHNSPDSPGDTFKFVWQEGVINSLIGHYDGPEFDEVFPFLPYATYGDYRLLICVLRYGGNPDLRKDWQTYLTPIIGYEPPKNATKHVRRSETGEILY